MYRCSLGVSFSALSQQWILVGLWLSILVLTGIEDMLALYAMLIMGTWDVCTQQL